MFNVASGHPINKVSAVSKQKAVAFGQTFNFEEALRKMKQGEAVTRQGWKDVLGMALLGIGDDEVHDTTIALASDSKLVFGFTPNVVDLLARDWVLFE